MNTHRVLIVEDDSDCLKASTSLRFDRNEEGNFEISKISSPDITNVHELTPELLSNNFEGKKVVCVGIIGGIGHIGHTTEELLHVLNNQNIPGDIIIISGIQHAPVAVGTTMTALHKEIQEQAVIELRCIERDFSDCMFFDDKQKVDKEVIDFHTHYVPKTQSKKVYSRKTSRTTYFHTH